MDTFPDPHIVTELLRQWGSGDKQALDQLMPLVYDQLRKQASRYLRAERPDHTLAATALVHEAYVRLVDSGPGAGGSGPFLRSFGAYLASDSGGPCEDKQT